MIVDAHCHLVPNDSGIAQTLSAMDEAGVDLTVLVPGGMISPLGMADFLRGREPLITSEPPNDFILTAVRQYPSRFAGFFQVDPSYHNEADLAEAVAAGFSGFKLSPLVNRVAFSDPAVHELFAYAQSRDMPIYTHIVANGEASLDALAPLVKRYRNLPVILGHMGFAATDASAIRLARVHDNLFLETSVGSFSGIREAVNVLGARKVLFGSEGPVHHPGVELRKIELLHLPPSDFERICGRNVLDLIRYSPAELQQ